MKEEIQKEKENLLKEYELNFYSTLRNFTGKSKIQEVQPSEILDYLQKNNIEIHLRRRLLATRCWDGSRFLEIRY